MDLRFSLPGGGHIPAMGMGTFGSDHCTAEDVAEAVAGAVRYGYRLIDCASVYENEAEIGKELQGLMREGVVTRGELFLMSKVWNDSHTRVRESCLASLKALQVDYLDAYYVHWPFPNYHAPGCDGDARNPDSVPFDAGQYLETWRQVEALVVEGLVRYAGMSNMTQTKLEAVLPHCRVRPALIEQELHPSFQQEDLLAYIKAQGIQPVAYCPLGSPHRPERDRTADDVVDMELPEVQEAARELGVSPADICLKWAYGRGCVTIPFSLNPRHFKANLDALNGPVLSGEQMEAMRAAERGCRLIKGQVFLWEGAEGWEALWE